MAGTHLLLGTRKGLLVLAQQGGDWKVVCEAFPGIHVSLAEVDWRTGTLYALVDSGHFGMKTHRLRGFLENGQPQIKPGMEDAFEEVPAPKYPEGSKLKGDKDAVLRYQWAFATGSDEQPGRIYIGTEPGGLFVSDNEGDDFQLVQSLWDHPSRLSDQPGWMGGGRDEAGMHSVCVDPRDPNRLYVGVSVAGVFFSSDGGSTWEVRNKGLRADFLPDPNAELGHDPHLLVQCRDQPDKLWQQNHCGVFRSVDAGLTWTDVSQENGPVGFGFAVAVDPHDGETAWVVPAESDMVRAAVDRQMCVARTTDGGKSWEECRVGLPQDNCFDFAFRHALDQHEDRIAFGTACGSVYVSDNRGDSFLTAGYHFPPIYSLYLI